MIFVFIIRNFYIISIEYYLISFQCNTNYSFWSKQQNSTYAIMFKIESIMFVFIYNVFNKEHEIVLNAAVKIHF